MKRIPVLARVPSLAALIRRLTMRMRALEVSVASQSNAISKLGPADRPSIQEMQIAEEARVAGNAERRDAMSEGELRVDLEKTYGVTRWARRLVDGIVAKRRSARKINRAASDVPAATELLARTLCDNSAGRRAD